MDEKLEINRSYEILDGDDDVLLLGKATFTIRHLKELATSKFHYMLFSLQAEKESRKQSIYYWMTELCINEETKIMGGDINWNSPQEGIDCQILKIGSKGWEKGKIQIEVNKNIKSGQTQTSIKFCPDEPPEQKSPLDDIRQSEAYKKLLEND